MINALSKYLEYENSSDEYLMYLRLNYQWNDERYSYMIGLVKNVLDEYKDKDVFPKELRFFFTMTIDRIIGIISNELFIKTIPDGFTKSEYIYLLENRKKELIDLKEEFFYGKI